MTLHDLPKNDDFNEWSDTYRECVLEQAYDLKKHLVDIDLVLVELLRSLD